MNTSFPKRKKIRLSDYDYSASGAYFITVCINDRKPILWDDDPVTDTPKLSAIGCVVKDAVNQISEHYDMISVDKYCIMPDHIHLLIRTDSDVDGRQVAAPTISTVVGSMKRWVSIQLGYSIWQKSFIDRVIRNDDGYLAVWEYIENNPIKLDTAYDIPDFDIM